MIAIPKLGEKLNGAQLEFLETFTRSCRHSIIEMVKNAQSGHPGGSLSCIDYLTVLYAFIISQHGNDVIVSNGHISPAVYSVLAEMAYIRKKEAVETFRKIGSIYEGHVTRLVPGVTYGTGPLGIGVSVASAFALAKKIRHADYAATMPTDKKNTSLGKNEKSPVNKNLSGPEYEKFYQQKISQKVFGLMGDGEAQEGQVYEMLHFASKYRLDNLIMFVDYNRVQLSDSLAEIMPIDLQATFRAAGWNVIDLDAHNFQAIWSALTEAARCDDVPTAIIGNTIMGKGGGFLEEDGLAYKATWHGKAPKPEEADKILAQLELSESEKNLLKKFRAAHVKWHPPKPQFPKSLSIWEKKSANSTNDSPKKIHINPGTPITYSANESMDCRSAYGKALLDLALHNKEILALTADLSASVMTKYVLEQLPQQHFEVGIAEQHMVSLSGGLSLRGFIPFCSTFGAFMTSRAKDQARVNDINQTNVKMVATHCGLSVGEDGPTHQAIDDMGSMLGLFNTMIIEPADPNHTDRIIRYIATHYGNFYVRMGRHKFPIITKEDGTPFYDASYKYEYGKCDIIREGKDITIAATGALISEALKAREKLANKNISVEIIAVSSIKKFDKTLFKSIKKTRKLITCEDHNPHSGLATRLAAELTRQKIHLKFFHEIAVEEYQLSGKAEELYHMAGIDAEAIFKSCLK